MKKRENWLVAEDSRRLNVTLVFIRNIYYYIIYHLFLLRFSGLCVHQLSVRRVCNLGLS